MKFDNKLGRHLIVLFMLFPLFVLSQKEYFPTNSGVKVVNEPYKAFVNATIVINSERTIENGTLIFRDGKIIDVGSGIKIPKNSIVVDKKNKFVYPSFIETTSSMSVKEAKRLAYSTRSAMYGPIREGFYWNDHILSDYRAYLDYKYDTNKAKELRETGFGVVNTHRANGIHSGTGILLALSDSSNENQRVLSNNSTEFYSFTRNALSNQSYPTSIMGSMALIRQFFHDLEWYSKGQAKNKDYAIEAAIKNITMPKIWNSGSNLNFLRALKISKELDIPFAVVGSGLEYMDLNAIRQYKNKLIIPVNFPAAYDVSDPGLTKKISLGSLREWNQAPSNLYMLEKNDIQFSVTSSGLKKKSELLPNLRKAIRRGLSTKLALDALTVNPASILKVKGVTGELTKGSYANFLVTSKPIFDDKSEIYENWVLGEKHVVKKEKKETPKNKVAVNDTIKKADKKPKVIDFTPVTFPNKAYGNKSIPQSENMIIRNATVWTNEDEGILQNTDVAVSNGVIVEIGKNLVNNNGSKEIDGTNKHLTTGIIDEHSHIAASSINESGHNSSAEVTIADVINPNDISIYRTLSGGVTTIQILHGSANPIGGQSAIVKLKWGETAENMLMKDAAKFIKFALGENVKQSNWSSYSRFPQSRMGVEQVYVDFFQRAKEYGEQWDKYNSLSKRAKSKTPKPRYDIEMEVVWEILRGERHISCHSYVQSEINMLMKVAENFGIKINTFTHILEGYKVATKMAKHGAGGSSFSDWWAYKYEVIDAIPYNGPILTEAGVTVAYNSDNAEMIRRLNQEAAKAVKYGGLSEEEAWKYVTLNPAKLLRIDDKVGSIAIGKHADLVIWSHNPLSIYALAEKTIIEGAVFYDYSKLDEKIEQNEKEREIIITQLKEAKKGGAKTEPAPVIDKRYFECETIDIVNENVQ
ncbi:MAG: amidohydrolase family protein [Flavobacteriaceae bacterium]